MASSLPNPFPCCDCILRLRPSSLREAFYAVCDYLNISAWATLCRHFMKLRLIEEEDMGAIGQASKLSRATPSQEMVLRLERKQNMTIDMLLNHIRNACDENHFKSIMSVYSPLHTKDCPVLSLTMQYISPNGLFQSYPVPYNHGLNPTMAYGHNYIPGEVLSHVQAQTSASNSIASAETSANTCPKSFHTGYPRNPSGLATAPPATQPESMNNLSDPFKPHLHITKHPTNQTLKPGDDLLLTCVAESDAPIRYSWMKNGKILDGFSDRILMIPDVQFSDHGHYECVAKTDALEVISDKARIIINLDHAIDYDSSYYATEKFALLIANEQYSNNIPTLSSASNDVHALASALQGLQFKTMTLINLTLSEMTKAVELFCNSLISGAYCVTYLAGHGFENDGQCYIVPVDAPRKYTAEKCFSIKKMIEDIRSSNNLGLAVFLLDVCRKRLQNSNGTVTRPADVRGMSGNFVVSHATMEHGMAYEVKGQKLGVYAASLKEHLKKDELVTRVLELAHKDIRKNGSTRGCQQPEFSSNIFEDRKLTDPIHSRLTTSEQSKKDEEWNRIHLCQKPNLYIFDSCGVDVELTRTCQFSNVFSIEAHVKESVCHDCTYVALITLKGHQPPRKRLLIENVQRLNNKDITFELLIRSTDGEVVDRYEDSIMIPFVTWWKQ